MTGAPAISGVLLVNKPEGPTSMDVCRVVKRALIAGGAPKKVKVGHGGTLDPLATGLIVVLVGSATKQCDRVMAGEKRYLAQVDLSAFTATDDREGEREEIDVAAAPSRELVERACAGFVGEIMQRPPAHSAMKVDGKRAYKLARAGTAPALEPRPVVVHAIETLAYDWPLVTLDIRCGKGTYIRSLARDLGGALGTGGSLRSLQRTAVGEFTLDQSVRMDDIPETLASDELRSIDVPGR